MLVSVRNARIGARIVRLDTYAHSPVSVPFYEQRMGYQRRASHCFLTKCNGGAVWAMR